MALAAVNDGDYQTAEEIRAQISAAQTDLRNEVSYQIAGSYAATQDYKLAAAYYTALSDYKDSAEQAVEMNTLQHRQLVESLSSAEIGGTVKFGTYDQNSNQADGNEAIQWTVLDRVGNQILLISKKGLAYQPYNSTTTDTTWETCSLRQWLNDDFVNQAFDANDQNYIQDSLVTADNNPDYGTDAGNDTTDKIFLLSATEYKRYTDVITNKEYWWLRTPGSTQDKVMIIGNSNYTDGVGVYYTGIAVRPAIWVNLDSQ